LVVYRFLQLLLVLTYFTAGQPPRGTELVTVRHRNTTMGHRSVLLHDGMVMIVTEYSKSMAQYGNHKIVCRFLPVRVGRLLVAYLSDALPFRRFLQTMEPTPWVSSTNLWESGPGRLWDTTKVTRILEQESGSHLGVSFNISSLRHVLIAIGRQFKDNLQGFVLPDDKGDNGDGGDDGRGPGDDIDDVQASHSTEVAISTYAVRTEFLAKLTPRLMGEFFKISERWHQFLGLLSRPRAEFKPPSERASRSLGALPLPPLKRARPSPQGQSADLHPSRSASAEDALKAIKLLFGPSASFRSPHQKKALIKVLQGANPLVVVLPTGGGKSVLYLGPTVLGDTRTTVVVTPFVALAADTVSRCEEKGIDCVEWVPGCCGRASIVVVGAERAVSGDFLTYLGSLVVNGRLARIIIDECHLIISAKYREKLKSLRILRAQPVQVVFLTATMPPSWEQDFADSLLMKGVAKWVRSPTIRRDIAYRVRVSQYQSTLEDEVCEFIRERIAGFDDWQRAVVYCRTRDQCTSLADELGCGCFYSQHEDNEKALEEWARGDHKMIVATGALGTGVDIQGITLVVHLEEPYTLVDFSQESGRGGRRQGETVESVVFVSSIDSQRARLDPMVQQYITTTKCRREVLSSYLDVVTVDCSTSGGLLCDLCQARQPIEAEGGTAVGSPVVLCPDIEDPDYTQGRQELQRFAAQSSDLERYICWCIDAFKGVCVGCIVFHGGSVHKPEECELVIMKPGTPQQGERLYTYVKEFRKGIKYEPNT
jgi:hypothetical protein